MTEYEVLGGHDVAEFRLREDGDVELHSSEEGPDGEEIGTVGTMTQDEFESVGDRLKRAFVDGEADVPAPETEELNIGQHPLIGALIFESKEKEDSGAMFPDPETVIDAVDSLE